nr:MFS transporter [Paenibacillus phyllosphaerae]
MLIGQALSFMGDYCVLPALLILSTYYQDYWVTSGVIIVRSLPMILQPFLGVFVDRVSRVKIMLWTDIVRGIIFLSVTLLPEGEYPAVFLLLLLLSYGSGIFFNPARLAVMSSLGEDIKQVNTLFAKATTLCVIAGALIGAGFLAFGSVKAAVAFNAVTYFVSAIFIGRMNIASEVSLKQNRMPIIASFKVGLQEIGRNSFVLNGVLTMMVMSVLCGVVYSYFPVVSQSMGDGEIGNFILTVTIGLGGFLGAQLVTRWGFNSDKGLLYFVLLSVASLAVFMYAGSFTVAFLAAVLLFVALEYGEVLAKVKVQEHAPNDMQGRIFAVSEAMIGLSISLGSVLMNLAGTHLIVALLAAGMALLFVHTKIVNKLVVSAPNEQSSKMV